MKTKTLHFKLESYEYQVGKVFRYISVTRITLKYASYAL